ncbi:MAG: NACHT domain-containing protein [Candidatus Thorarchaeota archaeon]
MPLAGGLSNKYGNRYEGKWTVFCLAKVMDEVFDSIRLEPPGIEGEGCEFVLKKNDEREYHQVKRQHSEPRSWTICDLNTNGVLTTAFNKTLKHNHHFHFTSTVSSHSMDELCESARNAESFIKFREEFISKGNRKTSWKQLIEIWRPLIRQEVLFPENTDIMTYEEKDYFRKEKENTFHEIAYSRLKRIHMENISEHNLENMVETQLRTLFRDNPKDIRIKLADLILENAPKEFYADDLWRWSEKCGYQQVDRNKDKRILSLLIAQNQRYEKGIKPIADGILIKRDEVDEAVEILTGEQKKHSVLISGKAGIGKTFILRQIVREIEDLGIPHLCFRVDTLESTALPSNVGEQLGLPASPVEVLAEVAKSRICILVIDQLDYISSLLGRNPILFGCIKEIIRESYSFPNMRLLIACRKFDLQNDSRLRKLISKTGPAQEVDISKLSLETVKNVLKDLKLPVNFSDEQIEFLQIPLHLWLLAEIIPQTNEQLTSIAGEFDLFNSYWKHKRAKVAERIGNKADQWIDVIDELCNQITEKQTKSIHENAILDRYRDTVIAMESENVLILSNSKIGFFHEAFFDYAFARRFVDRGENLLEYLITGGQHLYKRAPLRQILIHKHGVDHDAFVLDIKLLLSDPNIRYHIKQCSFEAIQRINQATPELWDILRSIISDDNSSLENEVWKVFYLTPDWFRFLNEKGLMTKWLRSDNDKVQNNAVQIIKYQIDFFPEKCIKLLEPYVESSPEWNRRLLWIIGWNPVLSTSRDVFELLIRLFINGAFDDKEAPELWSMIHALPKRQPEWAAEILGLYLKHILKDVNLEKVDRGLFKGNGSETSFFLETAKNAPEQFLNSILPLFMNVVKATAKERDGKLLLDGIWCFRSYDRNLFDLKDGILEGARIALRKLAEHSPEVCSKYLSSLMIYGDYDSANFLIVQAFGACSHKLSDTAVKYVSENPQRLEAGWSSGGGGDFEYWAAHEMIENVSTSCSDKAFSRLEQLILNHSPIYERSKEGLRWRGFWQMLMLSGLDPERRSPEAEKRLTECCRKFPNHQIAPPVASRGGTVHSPIPEDAAVKMSDSNWLNAIYKYNSDGRDHRDRKDFLKGNAHELSSVLQEEVKRDPTRFALLAQRFPSDTHPSYFGAIVRGLKDSDAEKDVAFDIVRHFFNLPIKQGGHWICSLIAKYRKEDIPNDILNILAWYATEATDPKDDSLTFHSGDSSDEDNPSFILSTAINSVRGVAADAIGKILFSNAERVSFFTPYLSQMIKDPTITVRSTVAYALLGLYTHDEKLAVSLFLKLCASEKDVLLATHYVDSFLHYATVRHYSTLQPLLKRMLGSENTHVREAGARHTILAYLSSLSRINTSDHYSRFWLMLLKMIASKSVHKRYMGNCLYSLARFSYPREVRKTLAGDDAAREGAVRVAAANVLHFDYHQFCNLALARFFSDPSKEIRDKAAGCFRVAKDQQLEGCTELIRAFLNRSAFEENLNSLIWPLKKSTADISEVIVEVCEAVISAIDRGIEPYSRFSSQVDNVVELILRAYQNSDDHKYRKRCLNLIDNLISKGVRRISIELREYERL